MNIVIGRHTFMEQDENQGNEYGNRETYTFMEQDENQANEYGNRETDGYGIG